MTEQSDTIRAAVLALVMVFLVVGGSFALAGTAGAVTSGLSVDSPTQPVQPGESVTVSATAAATAGNDITFAIDSDGDGSITATEVIGTKTSDGTSGDASITFTPSNNGMASTADGSFSVYSFEESDSDGTTSGPNADGTSSSPGTDYDQSVQLDVDGVAPTVSGTPEVTGSNTVEVTFSEGVYNTNGGSGDLTTSEFTYSDTSSDGASGISGVKHTAGSATATVTLTSDIQNSDLTSDTIDIAGSTIYDEAGNAVAATNENYADASGDDVNPTITSPISATESGSDVSITFSTDEQLSSISVGINSTTLAYADFTETTSGGDYVYTKSDYTPGSDGSYTATLNTLTDTGSNQISPGTTDSATVDTTGPTIGTVTSPTDPTNVNQPTVTVDNVQDDLSNVDTSSINIKLIDSSGTTVADYTGTGVNGLSYDAGASTASLDLSTTGDTLSDDTFDVQVAVDDDDGTPNSNSKTLSSAFEVDATAPTVSRTPEVTGSNTVEVTFSEGVYNTNGGSGALTASEFTYTDTSNDGASGIQGVQHTKGTATATLTLTSDIQNSDLSSDTIDIAASTIYDEAGNAVAGTSETYADESGDDVNPTITSAISATESGSDVSITFSTDEQLSSIDVGIDSTTLTLTEFSESGSGPYTYTASYTPGSDGSYTATLKTLTDTESNQISPGTTDSATVDTTGPTIGTVTAPTDPTNVNQPTVTVDNVQDDLSNVDTSTLNIKLVDSSGTTVADYTGTGVNGLSYDAGASTASLDLSTTGDTLSDDTFDVEVAVDDDEDGNSNLKTLSSAFEVDATAPTVSGTPEVTGSNTVEVTFSEGVYSTNGGSGDLTASEFTYTDTSTDGVSDISSVQHTAGSTTATVTLTSDIQNSDLSSDTIDIAGSAIYDEAGNAVAATSETYADASGDDGDGGGGGGGSASGPRYTSISTISDSAPGTSGTTVEFSSGAVNAITFSQEGVEGRVEVNDYGTNLPSSSPSTSDRPVFGSAEITVPESAANEPATVRMTVDQTVLLRANADAEDLAILRGTGGGYQMLDTTEVDSSGDVTIEAETPGFSTFIVSTNEGDIGLADETDAATDTPDEATPADGDDEPAAGTDTETPVEGTPPADADNLPGFGAVIALVALLGAALLAARRNAN